jgi:hypothetical protein
MLALDVYKGDTSWYPSEAEGLAMLPRAAMAASRKGGFFTAIEAAEAPEGNKLLTQSTSLLSKKMM